MKMRPLKMSMDPDSLKRASQNLVIVAQVAIPVQRRPTIQSKVTMANFPLALLITKKRSTTEITNIMMIMTFKVWSAVNPQFAHAMDLAPTIVVGTFAA